MKINTIAIFLCLGALVSATSLQAYATTNSDKSVAETLSDNTNAAIEEIKRYSADKKEIAGTKAKEIIADIDKRIQALQDAVADKTNDMTDAMRETKTKTIVRLQAKRQNLQDWYQKLLNSSTGAWEEIKQGFIRSYDSFQATYKNS